MSASTIIPAVSTTPAPAPATNRGQHELGVAACHRAPEIAHGRKRATGSQRRTSPQPIRHLAGGDAEQHPRQPVHGHRRPDRRLRHAERLRVQRQHRNHRTKAQLVDGDQHAHPHEDAAWVRFLADQQPSSPRHCAGGSHEHSLKSAFSPNAARHRARPTRRKEGAAGFCEGRTPHMPSCAPFGRDGGRDALPPERPRPSIWREGVSPSMRGVRCVICDGKSEGHSGDGRHCGA